MVPPVSLFWLWLPSYQRSGFLYQLCISTIFFLGYQMKVSLDRNITPLTFSSKHVKTSLEIRRQQKVHSIPPFNLILSLNLSSFNMYSFPARWLLGSRQAKESIQLYCLRWALVASAVAAKDNYVTEVGLDVSSYPSTHPSTLCTHPCIHACIHPTALSKCKPFWMMYIQLQTLMLSACYVSIYVSKTLKKTSSCGILMHLLIFLSSLSLKTSLLCFQEIHVPLLLL